MPNIGKKTDKDIGTRVRKVRKAAKKTQEWLAEKLGVDPNYISMIETGKRRLTTENAEKIAALFPPVRIQWLIGWDDFETEDDETEYEWQRSQRAGIMEQEMMKKIAHQAGYELSYRDSLIGGENYILSSSSGETVGLTLSEYLDFWYDFMDYAVFRLKRTVETKYNRNKITIDMGDSPPNEGGTDNG